MSSTCCCHCCCCGGCGGSCGSGSGCGCGGDQDAAVMSQFPVYVSYPAFFAGDSAIDGANQSIFTISDASRSIVTGRRSCGCRG